MATQEILVNYNADVSKLTEQLNKIASANDKVSDTSKQTADEVKKSTVTQEQAAKKRIELLKAEEAELKKLQADRKKAFDPKVIADFDKKIAESTTKIQTLGGKTAQSLAGVSSKIATIGAGLAASLGAMFTVGAIIEFGKASVNAFLEADKTANKLRNTIIAVNGESERAFDKLIKQSEELREISIFSDDSIQQAQAALAAFGLTSDQIEEIIPRLADFATISNTDIVTAAEKVGIALEGNGREFKKYNIQVTQSASRLENFETVLKGFVKFQGAASNAAQTFAGKLEIEKNKVNDLQERIGERLIPVFLKLKEFSLRAVEAIAELFGQEQISASEKAAESYGKIAAEFNLSIEVLKRGNLTQEQHKQLIDEINTQYGEYLPNLLTEKSSLEEIEKAQAAVNKQLEGRILLVALEEDIVRITKNAAKAAKDLILVQRDRIKAEKDLSDNAGQAAFTRNQLNQREALANELVQKGRDELSALQEQYAKLAAQLGINTSATDKLLQAQKGVNEASDVRIAGSAEEVKAIKLLGAEYSALFALLNDEQKQRLIELSVTAELDSEQEVKDKINRLEEIFKANGLTIPVSTDPEGSIPDLEKRLEQLKAELERNKITVPVDVELTALDNFRAQVAALAAENSKEVKIPITLEPRVDNVKFNDGIKAVEDQAEQLKEQTQELLSESESLLSSLTDLYQNYTDARLRQINDELNAQLDSLDSQETALQKNLERRRISETEAERLSEKLLKERTEAERQAAEKERALKRKQAILDKANALIQITINTAQGISKALAQAGPLGIALAALIAAAGAAQAAVVVSQPVAYKKGSKDTGAKEHMALVGEEGPEYVMMQPHSKVLPAGQSKTYGEALEAMRKKQFDQYISEKYVTPALIAQKKQDDKVKRKSFAENLAQSITYNTIAQTPGKKLQDVSVTNVDALARSIARELKQDIYR